MTPLCPIRDASPHWHRLGLNINLRWVHGIRLWIKCYCLMSEVVTMLPLWAQMQMLWKKKNHCVEVTCSQAGSHDPISKYNVLRLQQTAQFLFCKPGPAGFSLSCRPSHSSIHQNSVPLPSLIWTILYIGSHHRHGARCRAIAHFLRQDMKLSFWVVNQGN